MILTSLCEHEGTNEQNPGIQKRTEMDAGRTGRENRRRTFRRREMGKRQDPAAGLAARGTGRSFRLHGGRDFGAGEIKSGGRCLRYGRFGRDWRHNIFCAHGCNAYSWAVGFVFGAVVLLVGLALVELVGKAVWRFVSGEKSRPRTEDDAWKRTNS